MQPDTSLELDFLNDPQREAVEYLDGALLVLAGAGTGKTKVLTTRIANIIASKKAFLGEILAVTFTNKAARVMQERIAMLLGQDALQGNFPNIGTFHSLSARILRRYYHLIGLESNFVIVNTDDQLRIIKRIAEELGYNDKENDKVNYKAIVNQISSWKDKAINASNVGQHNHQGDFLGMCAAIYPIYQDELRRSNSCDFGDLILYVIEILSQYEEVQEYYNKKFKYVLVDEYQDTNTAQYLWLRLLTAQRQNICCVGDDDQSIYGFRGAQIENILRFEKDFKNAKVVKLQQNYRSTQHILNLASHLINCNQKRHKKTLFTKRLGGNKVKIIPNWDDKSEAQVVINEIDELIRNKHAVSEITILVRASFQTRIFEEALLTKAIPYKIIGGLKFYDRKEIKDIIAYLRVINSENDNLALERIINIPKRGVGAVSFMKVNELSRSNNSSLFAAFEAYLNDKKFSGKTKDAVRKFIEFIKAAADLKTQLSVSDLAKYVITHSGYEEMLRNNKELGYEAKLENLQEFYVALNEFDNLEQFLEHVGLVNDTQDEAVNEFVNVITLHSAKGLEFETVFLAGWEEGLFPHQKTIEESGDKGLEEERRLAYVGITRAKKNLYISYANNRRMFNQWQTRSPSRFLSELPQESIQYVKQNKSANYYQEQKQRYQMRQNNAEVNKFKINQEIKHNSLGAGKVKSVIGDVVEVNFDSGETRFVTASSLK